MIQKAKPRKTLSTQTVGRKLRRRMKYYASMDNHYAGVAYSVVRAVYADLLNREAPEFFDHPNRVQKEDK